MGTPPNDKVEIFRKENVLICWNPVFNTKTGDFANELENNGFSVVTSYKDFRKKYREKVPVVKSKKELKKEESDSENENKKESDQELVIYKYEGLVVLSELNWGLSTEFESKTSSLSEMSGIKLVKVLRTEKLDIPVVFVSFLSRAQQLKLSTLNEIISTPALGHFYERLPSTPDLWLKILNNFKQKKLTEMELRDLGHFCKPELMLSELKHDLLKFLVLGTHDRSERFSRVIKRINDITGDSNSSELKKIGELPNRTDLEVDFKINLIGSFIDEYIRNLNPDILPIPFPEKSIRVLFLDDEYGSDLRLTELIMLMEKNKIIIVKQPFTNVDEAYNEVEKDTDNQIDIIITDYRIWNKPIDGEPRLIEQIQGYSFLQKCANLHRTYTYVVLSALDRNFLMENIKLITHTLYKNGVLANKYSKLNFIGNLIAWGNENRNSLASEISENKAFIKCYNWYRSNSGKFELESKINDKTIEILKDFDKRVVPYIPTPCLYKKEKNCKKCKLYYEISTKESIKLYSKVFKIDIIKNITTNYHDNSEEWDPSNQTHVSNLINKFAARRLFLYFSKILNSKESRCEKTKQIAQQLVKSGKYDPEEKNFEFRIDKAIWLTLDLKKSPEEIEFLKNPPHLQNT